MKKPIVIVSLFFASLLNSQTPKWMTELSQMTEKNKSQHYWVSSIGTVIIGHSIYRLTNRVELSCFSGAVIMYGIGELKESVWDGKMKRGVESGGDRFMNGMGCFFGIAKTRVLIDIQQRNEEKKPIEY